MLQKVNEVNKGLHNYEVFVVNENEALIGYGGFNPSDFVYENKLNLLEVDERYSMDVEEITSGLDKWDVIASIASGFLASMIDIFYVNEFSLKNAQSIGEKEAEAIVMAIAKKNGYQGNDIKGTIRKLEDLFPLASDKLTDVFGGGKQHHLRDFTHHSSLLGWLFSVLSQFSGLGFGTDTNGNFIIRKLPAEAIIGKNAIEKFYLGTVVWFFHLISDIAGSSSALGKGTGIPGPLLSCLKELSVLPIFKEIKVKYKDNDIALSVFISKLFNGSMFKGNTSKDTVKFDLRTEMGIVTELTKQMIPVVVNECMVRSIYTIRRFCLEVKNKNVSAFDDLQLLEPVKFLPMYNESLNHMLTIASCTFTAIDTGEAAVAALLKSKGSKEEFFKNFVVKVNVSGICRFAIACKCEIDILLKKKANTNEQSIVPELSKMTLDYNQARIMYSLQLLKINCDIRSTRNFAKKEFKEYWKKEWMNVVISELKANDDFFVENKHELQRLIADEMHKYSNKSWMYIVSMELSLFKPYYTLDANSEIDYSKISYSFKKMDAVFSEIQDYISVDEIHEIEKLFNKYKDKISGNNTKKVVGTVVATAVTIVTGGLAWYFAPEIAVFLVGGGFALNGAALTSASLAMIGGGSLAVGGLGMAGGTAIITGGGALLGLASSGVTSMTATLLMSSKEYTLNECSKILTFSKYVLCDKCHEMKTVNDLCHQFEIKVKNTENDLKVIMEEPKNKKKIISGIKKSIIYMNRCIKQFKIMK